jgi:putative tryptophan/tyrosine transport system substrate-binding protein
VARAQQPVVPVIGLLSGSSPAAIPHLMAALQRGLAENGYVDGQNTTIERRFADGRFELLPAMAAELVRRPAAVIVTLGVPSTFAARTATATIPIVFHTGADVVKMGLVASLSRPGGNATGVNLFTLALEAKKVDLLNKLVPAAATFAYLMNPNNLGAEEQANEVREAARNVGRRVDVLGAGTAAEIDAAVVTLADRRIRALVIMADQYFDDTRRAQLIALAARHQIPTIYGQREYVVEGGLISYGTNLAETHRQAGDYAGRILKGARPDELPVLRPTKFELVINHRTAKTLALDISDNMLTIADEVIE